MKKRNVKIINLKKLTQIEVVDVNGKKVKIVGLLIKKGQYKTDVFFPLGRTEKIKGLSNKINKIETKYIG